MKGEVKKPWSVDFGIVNKASGFIRQTNAGDLLEEAHGLSEDGEQSLDMVEDVFQILEKVSNNVSLTEFELQLLNFFGFRF